jgi:hypothetical protein
MQFISKSISNAHGTTHVRIKFKYTHTHMQSECVHFCMLYCVRVTKGKQPSIYADESARRRWRRRRQNLPLSAAQKGMSRARSIGGDNTVEELFIIKNKPRYIVSSALFIKYRAKQATGAHSSAENIY